MKIRILTFLGLLVFATAFGQVAHPKVIDTTDIANSALEEIQVNFLRRQDSLVKIVSALDIRDTIIRRAIRESNDALVKARNLQRLYESLNARQTAIETNELYIYQTNYQSALLNLVKMNNDLLSISLFHSSKSFFSSLNTISNPMVYPEYQIWYPKFKAYVEKKKGRDAGLDVLSRLLTLTGDLSEGTPLSGIITEPLLKGIALYISTIGNSRKELKKESEKMFSLTARIVLFKNDKELIENDWTSITKELDELKKHYGDVFNQNLKSLSTDTMEFKKEYTKQQDPNKQRYVIDTIEQRAKVYVARSKATNSKEWKELIFYQLMDVQALKLRFGNVTLKVSQILERHSDLIKKYKNDDLIGYKVLELATQLNKLQKDFEETFYPINYINYTTRMYKLN